MTQPSPEQSYGQAPQYGAPTPGQYGPPVGQAQLAGMGARLGARLIDGVILLVAQLVLSLVFMAPSVFSGQFSNGTELAFSALGAAVAFGYELVFLVTKGATPGKMVVGIKVVHAHNAPLTWGTGALRVAIMHLPGLVPLVGWIGSVVGWIGSVVVCLSPCWDSQRQGFHDKAAKTWVVTSR